MCRPGALHGDADGIAELRAQVASRIESISLLWRAHHPRPRPKRIRHRHCLNARPRPSVWLNRSSRFSSDK